MIEYVSSFLLLTLLGIIYYIELLQIQNIFLCYKYSDGFGNSRSIKQSR